MAVATIAARSFSTEQKREHVLAYLERQHGTTAYLQEHGLSYSHLFFWRKALADGDLARGQVPRHTGSMTQEDAAEVRRLEAEVERLIGERDKAVAERDQLARAADALGKAIDVMDRHGVGSREDEPC
ncbi:transposase [Ornithinimicrobium faecis]|nr:MULTISPECIES: transposase [unclassified Ornithinimicrobium]